MSAIRGISRGCKNTLADGTVRYLFDFDPQDAADVAKLWGMPGTEVGVVAFTKESSQKDAQDTTIAAARYKTETVGIDKPKRGLLSQWAAQRSEELEFQDFLIPVYDKYMGGDGNGIGDIDWQATKKDMCKHAIYVMCDITSRACLDRDSEAKQKFDTMIRLPYANYLKVRNMNEPG